MTGEAVCIVGAGAVGSSLALRLDEVGYPVRAILSRTRSSVRSLTERLPDASIIAKPEDIPADCNLVVFCVPDEAQAPLSEGFASARASWRGAFVAHVSGVHPVTVLEPFARRGAAVFGFHPIQTFPHRLDPEALDGCFVGIEGDGAALAFAKRLATNIRCRPVVVHSGDKSLYHLAASIASNHFIALLLAIEKLAATRDHTSEWTLEAFFPLIQRTLDNARDVGPHRALTGPIVRGDVSTVARHLDVLQAIQPRAMAMYRELSRLLLDEAIEKKRLDQSQAEQILYLLASGSVRGETGAQGVDQTGPERV